MREGYFERETMSARAKPIDDMAESFYSVERKNLIKRKCASRIILTRRMKNAFEKRKFLFGSRRGLIIVNYFQIFLRRVIITLST